MADEQHAWVRRSEEFGKRQIDPSGPADVAAGWHGGHWYAPRDYGAQAQWAGQTGARESARPHAYRPRYEAPDMSTAARFGDRDEGQPGDYLGGHGFSGVARQNSPRRRGPKGYRRSDERIGEVLYELLIDATFLDSSEVTIAVSEGKVTLEGTVPERSMKHAIEDIVADCFGVTDIENRIRVLPPVLVYVF
jgi:osmotically-inducible protein OsmY